MYSGAADVSFHEPRGGFIPPARTLNSGAHNAIPLPRSCLRWASGLSSVAAARSFATSMFSLSISSSYRHCRWRASSALTSKASAPVPVAAWPERHPMLGRVWCACALRRLTGQNAHSDRCVPSNFFFHAVLPSSSGALSLGAGGCWAPQCAVDAAIAMPGHGANTRPSVAVQTAARRKRCYEVLYE